MKRTLFIFIMSAFLCYLGYFYFLPVYESENIIITYAIHPFNLYTEYPQFWTFLKLAFPILYFISSIILSHLFYNIFQKIPLSNSTPPNVNKISPKTLSLYIGKIADSNNEIFIPEKSLYQNILITGTIGTGKTSSAMYPFSKQLISYKCNNYDEKIGMLILDVKGNYYTKMKEYVSESNRQDDLIIIELGGKYHYNPLDKPNLKASVLANRLKTILLLFSPNNTESYWLDTAEKVLSESIKLCRLYNNQYVTFQEIHKLVTSPDYYKEKTKELREKFLSNIFNTEDTYNLLSSLEFFEKEFFCLDTRTLSILQSEITRITNCFISDYEVLKTFNPIKSEINFYGLQNLIAEGKIVILKMNLAEYKSLSKIIATYLKLDFQSEVMMRISHNFSDSSRPVAFISDEYQEFCTISDADFFAQSREAKCINIVSTQSYTSLLNSLNNSYAVKVILQNLINKLWFRTDDIFTIEETQKQLGKEEKQKESRSISESAKQTTFNYLINSFTSKDSSLSESINTYTQLDYIYDTNFFTQHLENFTCLAFLSDGDKILKPQKINLVPYFIHEKKFY